MLGIRHLDTFAFDLWVGDACDFYADCWILPAASALVLNQESHAQVVYPLKSKDYASILHDEALCSLISEKKLRHVAMLGLKTSREEAENELRSLFELVKKPIAWPKKMRISIVLADQNYYQRYQACLFALCPE